MIRRERGGSIEDLKLRREEEESARRYKGQVISMDLIQAMFEANPLTGSP
jgi:hypothetical protein